MGRIADVFDLSSTAATGFVARDRAPWPGRAAAPLGRPAHRRVRPDPGRRALPRGARRASGSRPSGSALGVPRARAELSGFHVLVRRILERAGASRHDRAAPDLPRAVQARPCPGRRPARRPGARDALPPRAQRRRSSTTASPRATPTYILQTGVLMLGDLGGRRGRLDHRRLLGARRRAWPSGATCAARIFRKVESFSRAELDTFGTPSLITRNTNDVQQVQMVVLMGLNMMIIAPILAVGGIILALRQDVPLSGILVVVLPIMALIVGTLMYQGAAAVPGDAGEGRPGQPGHPRGAQRHPRHPGVRPDAPRGGALRRRQHRPDRDLAEGQPDVRDHDPAAHGGVQPDERRDPVVRRDPGRQRRDADRQPHRVPAVRHADPVRGDDGRVHVHHGPAGRRLLRRGSRRSSGPSPSIGDPEAPVDAAGRRAARSPSATSSSATRAPRTRSCAASRWSSNRA